METEKIVEDGYNKNAEEYGKNRNRFSRTAELDEFSSMLPGRASVLDIGCGTGIPVTKYLVRKGFSVTGLDISERMIELAKKNVPQAKFIRGNIMENDLEENSFDGITAFYSIIHVPREKHGDLFKKLHVILKSGGILLASMGPDEWEGMSDDFHGAKMWWSYYSPKKSLDIIKSAGFGIIFEKVIEDGGERHYWVMAKNK